MSKIIITDLYNNTKNISNDSEFILLHTLDINNLLVQLDYNEGGCIYGYNIAFISKVLKNINLDINNFKFLYHIHSINGSMPKYIVLANYSITRPIVNYTLVDNFNRGYLWYPDPVDNFYGIGLVYTNSTNQPSDYNFALLNENYIIKDDDNNDLRGLNNMHQLCHPSVEKYIILKKNIFCDIPHSKLNDSNKYIIHDINDNLLKVKNKEYKNKQMISYNPQGELVVNYDVKNNIEQDCNSCSTRVSTISDNIVPNNFEGKKVFLTGSENPWYNNINDPYNFSVICSSESSESSEEKIIENLDVDLPDVKNINSYNNGTGNYMKLFNLIISILLILLIIYLIYKNY